MEPIVWIILVVVLLLVIGALIALMNSRKKKQMEADRVRATEMRQETQSSQADMRQAELEAEQRRVEAERAQLKQQEAERGLAQQQAVHEDRLREADRIDPDVDHRADDYAPTTPDADPRAGSTGTTGTGAATGAAAGAMGTGESSTAPTQSQYDNSSDTVFDDRSAERTDTTGTTTGSHVAGSTSGTTERREGLGVGRHQGDSYASETTSGSGTHRTEDTHEQGAASQQGDFDSTTGERTGATDDRPPAYGGGSVDDSLKHDDTYVDENGVLRNKDGSEYVRRDDNA